MTEGNLVGWSERARGWLREPFIHFVLLGLLLFVGHAVWQSWQDEAAKTIVVDPEEMERRAILFAGENQRNPTEDELKALLYDYVQEEALVREAQKLGLGEGDTIVRRRLAQKARFMLEDTVDVEAPDKATLCTFLDDNPDRFAEPPRRTFAHIFVTPNEMSDAQLRARAAPLKSQATNANWKSLGDPFLLNRSYDRASYPDVAKSFGVEFAKGLFALDMTNKGFQGPIPSSFGLHLVRVDAEQKGAVPQCDNVLPQLEETWRRDQRERANAQSVRDLVEQYEVVVAE